MEEKFVLKKCKYSYLILFLYRRYAGFPIFLQEIVTVNVLISIHVACHVLYFTVLQCHEIMMFRQNFDRENDRRQNN